LQQDMRFSSSFCSSFFSANDEISGERSESAVLIG